MDFRDRNPIINRWTGDSVLEFTCPFPFDGVVRIPVLEYQDPAKSTIFWATCGGGDEDANFNLSMIYYLIESPHNCPMRKAFIYGEISWAEYWCHKPWLIELQMQSIFDHHATVRYISPAEISDYTRREFTEYENQSPLQIKHDILFDAMKWESYRRKNDGKASKEYEAFVRIYGSFVNDEAA